IETDNTIRISKFREIVHDYPKKVRNVMIPEVVQCHKLIKKHTLRNLDETCSSMMPILRCISKMARKHCDVGDYGIFLTPD
ncbi:unnamed protein product, partial [Allacma fusca]